MQKEAKNYQFDFLRPQHTLFQYFSKLVEQYNKVLIPSKLMRNKIRQEMGNQQLLLDDVNYRAEWGRYQERIRKQEQEKQEKVFNPFFHEKFFLKKTFKISWYLKEKFRNALRMQKSIGTILLLLKL